MDLTGIVPVGRARRAKPTCLRPVSVPTTESSEGVGGPDRDRTGDLMNAIHARSQLRYRPTLKRSLELESQ